MKLIKKKTFMDDQEIKKPFMKKWNGLNKKMGKLLISHRYNHLPLLPSGPGGVHRSWSYKTYPVQK